jgi:hypothetical protein
MSLRMFALLALTTLTASCSTAHVPPPREPGYGRLAQVEVIDRTNGTTLPVYWYRGQRWIAGTPGHRYAIAVRNRSGGRILTVIAVDGVNAVSGETASWGQTGYVLEPGRGTEIRGWRKSTDRVAAFEFTALENSYAARTGRPENVGVIGVAVFREKPQPEIVPLAPAPAAKANADSGTAQEQERAAGGMRAEPRLGTGHGRSETSRVTYTEFERARNTPDEIVTLRYDSRENLIAMGAIPRPRPLPAVPAPFPNSEQGFVPDPPH